MRKKRYFGLLLTAAALVYLAGMAAAADTETRFEELTRRYGQKAERTAAAEELRTDLEAKAEPLPPERLWRSLFLPGQTAEQGAANGLALLSALVKGGDPVNWEGASGFFLPSEVPKPLVAADAVYMSSVYLLKMEEEAAGALAAWLMVRLLDSPRGKHFFISTGPAEYGPMVRDMTARELLPSFGVWPGSVARGVLPFAAPVRGWVSYGTALMREMVFLDGAGRPASNGLYAWDRDRGRIYMVIQELRRIFPFD
ncbi:MAG: hypothetical protein GX310_05785 [Synergistaceae bacterium]|nr:hypothetical protein [Synergistaceae bacterium]